MFAALDGLASARAKGRGIFGVTLTKWATKRPNFGTETLSSTAARWITIELWRRETTTYFDNLNKDKYRASKMHADATCSTRTHDRKCIPTFDDELEVYLECVAQSGMY